MEAGYSNAVLDCHL